LTDCKCSINGFTYCNQEKTESRPWGWFFEHFCSDDLHYRIKTLCVDPGHQISVQYHKLRSEFWYIPHDHAHFQLTLGENKTILRGKQTVNIPVGLVHSVKNMSSMPLIIYETQYGEKCLEEDIIRIHDPYQHLR
jgi:mannose-6-phosphate isomerase